jgi:hypothetical protein
MTDIPINPQGSALQENDKENQIPTKKIVSALLTALEHKLGREPTPEELSEALNNKTEMLQNNEQSTEQSDEDKIPKILLYKILYGLKTNSDGTKEPDPETPMFYENHNGTGWFSVDSGCWLTDKPSNLDHFYSRCLGDSDNQKDLFDAIVYGVMDEDDYNNLSQTTGMLDPRCVRAYELHKRAQDQLKTIQDMQKSAEQMIAQATEPGHNAIQEIMEAAGVAKDPTEVPFTEPDATPRQILLETPYGVDPRLARYIRAEIDASMDLIIARVVDALHSADEPPTDETPLISAG